MGLFDGILGGFLGCDDTLFCNCYFHQQKRAHMHAQMQLIFESYPTNNAESGFVIDGEYEDITNKRALPELEKE